MAANPVKILLIEDNLAEARLLQEFLKQAESHDFTVVHVQRLAAGLQKLLTEDYDVILLDLTLPDSHGLASLPQLMKQAPTIPIVVLTNTNDDELAIQAVQSGAQDYLVKRQVNVAILIRSIRYAIARKQTLETLRNVNQDLEHRVEEKTAELIKAKEINQFKSEFVSMLSHDIRNPLNTILLATGLLQNSDVSKEPMRERQLTPEKKRIHFQLIRSAIKNIAHLLDEVSFIGKADAGKLPCELVYLDLAALCNEIVTTAKLKADDTHLNIVFSSHGDLRKIPCDEDLIRHILENLLGNAIKYSPVGGKVVVELSRQEEAIIFQVQDWGIGIPETEQQQLFQPFYRASNVDNIPGTGMGLAIVKKCVEAHHGEIYINSTIGLGTLVTVKLPL